MLRMRCWGKVTNENEGLYMEMLRENLRKSPCFFSTEKAALDLSELHRLGHLYKKSNRGRIMHTIAKYLSFMNDAKLNSHQKLEKIQETQEALQTHMQEAENKEFGLEIMNKLNLDIYQKMQAFTPPVIAERLKEAFESMLKLNRLNEFNKVVLAAILHNKLSSESFVRFLHHCIQNATIKTNMSPL